ncbi:MAG: hypothetical protein PHY45_02465 [Rhodocyclaceae bacterium]|nr:hypothetical protein [Rhodocyclaceae bacterium]
MKVFGSGILFGTQLTDATGAAVSNPTPVQFGTMQDISADLSFEEKLLYGSYQMPIAIGRGKGKLQFKAKNADINSAIVGDLFFGLAKTAGIKDIYPNFPASVPASTPWTVTIAPPNTGTFVSDQGVINASTGLPMTRVATGPTTGQYSVNAATGVYTFATADANLAILISYEYSATSTAGPKYINISNQLMGYAPTFRAAFDISYGGKNATMVLNNCASSKLTLPFKNDDFSIPEFDFSAFADASNNIGYIALSE